MDARRETGDIRKVQPKKKKTGRRRRRRRRDGGVVGGAETIPKSPAGRVPLEFLLKRGGTGGGITPAAKPAAKKHLTITKVCIRKRGLIIITVNVLHSSLFLLYRNVFSLSLWVYNTRVPFGPLLAQRHLPLLLLVVHLGAVYPPANPSSFFFLAAAAAALLHSREVTQDRLTYFFLSFFLSFFLPVCNVYTLKTIPLDVFLSWPFFF